LQIRISNTGSTSSIRVLDAVRIRQVNKPKEFEILVPMNINSVVFWEVTPRNVAKNAEIPVFALTVEIKPRTPSGLVCLLFRSWSCA
jgi:hypothetical protein